MGQDYTGHICVAVIIMGIMFILMMDIFSRNRAILQSYSKKTEVQAPAVVEKEEETNAYPFYVDCTPSLDHAQLET